MAGPYRKELQIACLAVQRAVMLTKLVLASVDKGAQAKEDNSPVTVADFGAQALLIGAIQHVFPHDDFVGEESADALRADPALREHVWDLVRETRLQDPASDEALGHITSEQAMLDVIDRGQGHPGRGGRVWILDPIDGTKPFMTGGQYAVCLALVEDGEQKIGVLGCPNLDVQTAGEKVSDACTRHDGQGTMVFAAKDHGAFIRPLSQASLLAAQRIHLPPPAGPLRFVDSSSSRTADFDRHRRVASRLGSAWPGTEVFSLQMRYAALAVGHCDVMIRIPRRPDYREPVWDHAGGVLIVQEAGGTVTDLDGRSVDCGRGRSLQANHGLVAAMAGAHERVLTTTREILTQL